jgi:hypothetical protein
MVWATLEMNKDRISGTLNMLLKGKYPSKGPKSSLDLIRK